MDGDEERAGARRRSLSTVDAGDEAHATAVIEDRRELPGRVVARRVGVVALALFVGLGLTGFLGVRSASRHVEGGGVTLDVSYARVTRPGLATPLLIEVRRPGGFDAPVVIELDADYFALFDLNGIYPSPAAETSAGEHLQWEFDPPEGGLLRVELDVRTSPARAAPGSTRIAVLDPDGAPLATTRIDTLIIP